MLKKPCGMATATAEGPSHQSNLGLSAAAAALGHYMLTMKGTQIHDLDHEDLCHVLWSSCDLGILLAVPWGSVSKTPFKCQTRCRKQNSPQPWGGGVLLKVTAGTIKGRPPVGRRRGPRGLAGDVSHPGH